MKAPKRWPTAADFWMLAVALFLWLVVLPWQAAHGAERVQPGDAVTFTDAGRGWCARVWSIATGPDSGPWAWVIIDADPRRVFHVPLEDLRSGCRV